MEDERIVELLFAPSEDGEQKGHPLMFYLSREGIESVRFSVQDQEPDRIIFLERQGGGMGGE